MNVNIFIEILTSGVYDHDVSRMLVYTRSWCDGDHGGAHRWRRHHRPRLRGIGRRREGLLVPQLRRWRTGTQVDFAVGRRRHLIRKGLLGHFRTEEKWKLLENHAVCHWLGDYLFWWSSGRLTFADGFIICDDDRAPISTLWTYQAANTWSILVLGLWSRVEISKIKIQPFFTICFELFKQYYLFFNISTL